MKKGNTLLLVVSVIALVATVAAGYFYLQLDSERAASGAYNKSLPPITVPPTKVDETANWKTYSDQLNRFTFNYTPDWTIKNLNNQSSPGMVSILPPNLSSSDGQGVVQIWPFAKTSATNIQDFMDKFLEEVNPATGTKEKSVYKFEQNGKIDGNISWNSIGGCCGGYGKHIFVLSNGEIYIISQYYSLQNLKINPNFQRTFDQILSTFKFTDSTSQTTSWKTYENQFSKFKIDYPSDWAVQDNGHDQVQGSLVLSSPEAKVGVITIYWGGGFGGGACPKDSQLSVQTKAGILGMCRGTFSDGSEILKRSNGGQNDTLKDPNESLEFQAAIKAPYQTNEEQILNILKTFNWL